MTDEYRVVLGRAVGKRGQAQRFSTALLVRGDVGPPLRLASRWEWVNRELDHFAGNLVAHRVTLAGARYRVLSAYSPAWPVDPVRLKDIDVEPVKLKLNPRVWVSDLVWAALSDADAGQDEPWIVGGDFNSSETFDYMWPGGPRGNREHLDRMQQLGLSECLRRWNGALVPTFRNPRGGKVVHQMDHLFVSSALATRLVSCATAEAERVFGERLSDHLPIVADFSD